MAITSYLAMTAAEVTCARELPPNTAWMACHFSPYSTGISNLPEGLPEGSMLILNDITPIHGHDPQRIAQQLKDCAEANKCAGLVLDFQRQQPELAKLADCLTAALPCPVAYFGDHEGPLFVPPIPCHIPAAQYFSQWNGREIWLEIGLTAEALLLTNRGCEVIPITGAKIPDRAQKEETLHCHYHIALSDTEAQFTLWRTKEDLAELLEEADGLGIHTAIGLWQELQ